MVQARDIPLKKTNRKRTDAGRDQMDVFSRKPLAGVNIEEVIFRTRKDGKTVKDFSGG